MRTKEYRVELSDEERAELLGLVRRGTAAARPLTRAYILLAAGEDAKAEATLVALACTAPPEQRTVWTMQLLADRLIELHVTEAISDETVRHTAAGRTLGKQPAHAVAAPALVPARDGRGVRRAHDSALRRPCSTCTPKRLTPPGRSSASTRSPCSS